MLRLLSSATPLQQAAIDQPYYEAGRITGLLLKTAASQGTKLASPILSYGLTGKLYLSQSGWLLLSVPNAIGRGFFDALQEPGVELPTRDTDDANAVFNAHISIMSKAEVDQIGAERISERGHAFHYTTGGVKEITPTTWNGVSKVWALEILSPELKNLRKSYGLAPLPGPDGNWPFHMTFAIRRKKVLQPGEVSKAAAGKLDSSYSPEHPEECCPCCGARQEQGDDKCNRCGGNWLDAESAATSGIGWTIEDLRDAIREAVDAHRTPDENDGGLIDVWCSRGSNKIQINSGDWCTREAHAAYRAVADRFGEADMVNEAGLPDENLWLKVYPESADVKQKHEHYKETHKEANGDMLAFKAWKATGLSDEEADRKAGESLELPGDKKITPVIRNKRTREEEFEVCPHCNEEIHEKGYYVDKEGYEYHRGCIDAGPIRRLDEGLRALMKSADLAADVDAAAAECEEPKSKEQAEAGNYRHGHCRLHGMGITIETGRGMKRKGTDKNGKAWSITLAHHYGYIKRTESEADGDHIDVFIGPDPESELIFVVDQIDPDTGKFDEAKCMLGFTSMAAAKQGYLDSYAANWNGFDGITAITLPDFKEWIKNGDTGKPFAKKE